MSTPAATNVILELETEFARKFGYLVDRLNDATGAQLDDLQMLRMELIQQQRSQRGDTIILIEVGLSRLERLAPQIERLTANWQHELQVAPPFDTYQYETLQRNIETLTQWNTIAQTALEEQGAKTA